jgi:hypothetical protein
MISELDKEIPRELRNKIRAVQLPNLRMDQYILGLHVKGTWEGMWREIVLAAHQILKEAEHG